MPDWRRGGAAARAGVTIAEQLAGWGALLEVVNPDEVCAELARISRELVTRYATTA